MTVEELRRILGHLPPELDVFLCNADLPYPLTAVFLRRGGLELCAQRMDTDRSDEEVTA